MQGACKWCKFLLLTLKCSDIHIRRQRLNWKSLLRFFFFFLWMLPWSRFYVRKEWNNERKHVVNNRTEGNCHRLFSPTVSTSYWRWWNCASAQNIKQYYLRPKPSHLCWRICKKKKKVLWADFTNHASKYTLMFHFVVIIELWCPDIWTAP